MAFPESSALETSPPLSFAEMLLSDASAEPSSTPFADLLPEATQSEPPFDPSMLANLLPTEAEALLHETPLPTKPVNEPEVKTPNEVPAALGFKFVYGAILTLSSKLTAHSLRVEHELPEGVEVVATAPASKRVGNKLVWFFGEVKVEQRLSLKVTVRTKDPEWKPSTNRAAFLARYSCRGAVIVPVVRQAVKVTVESPNEIEVGASGTFLVRISNPGNWPLRGAILKLTTSNELQIAEESERPLDDMPAKHSITVPISVAALQAGNGTLQASLKTSDGPSSQATATCRLTAPGFGLRMEGPREWFVGRDHTVSLIASNPGTASAKLASFRWTLPQDWELLSEGVEYDTETRTIFFNADSLAPGSEWPLRVTVRPSAPGDFTLIAEADIASGLRANADLSVQVRIHPEDSDSIVERFVREVGFTPDATAANLQRSLASPRENLAPVREHPHVVFVLAGTSYALPLGVVREVSRPPNITPIPGGPDWLAGVANVRGDVISMVDLGSFFGESSVGLPTDRRLLIVTSPEGEITTGLLVDRVTGLRAVPPALVREPAAPLDFRAASYMRGVADAAGHSMVVLSPERLLLSPDFQPFGSM